MSQLTVTVLQLGLLVLLWLFVLGVVAVLRRDLFGTRAAAAPSPLAAAPSSRAAAPEPPGAPAPAPPAPQRHAPASPPRAGEQAPRRLVVTEGPRAGTTVELTGEPVLLGRAPDCTLVLGDDYASGHHARFVPAGGGQWALEDLGSTNGTTLGRGPGSSPVRGTVAVRVGSVVRIGRTTVELRG